MPMQMQALFSQKKIQKKYKHQKNRETSLEYFPGIPYIIYWEICLGILSSGLSPENGKKIIEVLL